MDELLCPNCGHIVPIPVPDRSIRQELLDKVEDTGQPDVAAGAVLGSVLPPEPANYFFTPVEQFARTVQRGKTRVLEKTIMSNRDKFQRDDRARKKLLDRTFSIGDSQLVPWGTATVAQHHKRIELQKIQRGGIDADIKHHQNAIEWIESTPGATCLNDVPGGEQVVPEEDAS